MIKRIGFIAVLIISAAQAQTINLEWAKSMGSTTADEGWCIITDALGNVFTAGRYEGTVDFDPGAGTANLVSSGDRDIFIQKLDGAGAFVWAKSIGGTLRDDGYSLATDASGNLFVTGRYEGTVDFDPGPSISNLVSGGNRDIFVLKLDVNGDFAWAKSMGSGSGDRGTSIATDASGNVYTTGYFGLTVDFDPGGTTQNLISNGAEDVFIQKLDGAGAFVWAKSVGGAMGDETRSLAIDGSGNVVVTGFFGGTVDFDPSGAVFNLVAADSSDIFIQKLDAAGNFLWAKAVGGATFDAGQAVVTDDQGNIVVTGYYSGTVDFDPGAGTSNLVSTGGTEAFVLKLNASGDFLWVASMGGTSNDEGRCLDTDTEGNVYATGFYQSTVDFDPGAGSASLTSKGATDVFVQKLNANGDFVWAESVGGTSSESGHSMAVSPAGIIYLTGYFQGTVDFDPNATSTSLNSAGDNDIYVAKYSQVSTVAIAETSGIDAIGIFPNPSTGTVNIDFGGYANPSIKVLSMEGKVVLQKDLIATPNYKFTLRGEPGIYLIQVFTDNGSSTYKLIKQ